MQNILPLLLLAITLTIAISARAECPSDAATFCSFYERAQQGHAKAQNNLGWMYATGEGVITDYREAFIWFSIAKANGYERAAGNLDLMHDRLTIAEIESARREAAQRLEAIDQR